MGEDRTAPCGPEGLGRGPEEMAFQRRAQTSGQTPAHLQGQEGALWGAGRAFLLHLHLVDGFNMLLCPGRSWLFLALLFTAVLVNTEKNHHRFGKRSKSMKNKWQRGREGFHGNI